MQLDTGQSPYALISRKATFVRFDDTEGCDTAVQYSQQQSDILRPFQVARRSVTPTSDVDYGGTTPKQQGRVFDKSFSATNATYCNNQCFCHSQSLLLPQLLYVRGVGMAPRQVRCTKTTRETHYVFRDLRGGSSRYFEQQTIGSRDPRIIVRK